MTDTRAAEHAAEAERLLADVHAHVAKRGRKMGPDQMYNATLANAHATLAVFYQRDERNPQNDS